MEKIVENRWYRQKLKYIKMYSDTNLVGDIEENVKDIREKY